MQYFELVFNIHTLTTTCRNRRSAVVCHLYRCWVQWITNSFDYILGITLISIYITYVMNNQFTSVCNNFTTWKPLPMDVRFWIALCCTENGCSSSVVGLIRIKFQTPGWNWKKIKTMNSANDRGVATTLQILRPRRIKLTNRLGEEKNEEQIICYLTNYHM